MYFDDLLLDEIREINWFSNVGNLLLNKKSIITLESWKECEENIVSNTWEETTLKARNELTSYLATTNSRVYDETWNEIAKEGRSILSNDIMPRIEKIKIPINDLDIFYSCIRWDLLGILMENAYKQYKDPNFFLRLLAIYELGHLPCGWKGQWPDGKLITY